MKGHTILLADDSEDDRFLLRIALKKADFDCSVQEADNGQEAIARLKGEGAFADRVQFPLPSLVIMDLNMPLKSGFEVLAWARAQPTLQSLSMIVMTASMRPEDIQKAYDLGATAYLVKPIELHELEEMAACLRKWIRMNHFPPRNDLAR
jgi:CheY-like chemotaxis protein